MQLNVYAFVAALNADSSKGLYRELYFPLIKYAIIKLYSETRTHRRTYYSPQDLSNKVKKLFGITIEKKILQSGIRNVATFRNGNIDLQIKDKDELFRVFSADIDDKDESYREKEQEFASLLSELDSGYRRVLEVPYNNSDKSLFTNSVYEELDEFVSQLNPSKQEDYAVRKVEAMQYMNSLALLSPMLLKLSYQIVWGAIMASYLVNVEHSAIEPWRLTKELALCMYSQGIPVRARIADVARSRAEIDEDELKERFEEWRDVLRRRDAVAVYYTARKNPDKRDDIDNNGHDDTKRGVNLYKRKEELEKSIKEAERNLHECEKEIFRGVTEEMWRVYHERIANDEKCREQREAIVKERIELMQVVEEIGNLAEEAADENESRSMCDA